MYQIRKLILAIAVGFAGMSGAHAQDTNMTPENLATPENQAVPEALSPQSPESAENRLIVWQPAGQATAPKIFVQRFDFRPRFDERIYGVRLIGLNRVVNVVRAQLVLRNGQVFNLNNLTGFLQQGRIKRVFLNGVRIRGVRIWATSPILIGSRGSFQLDFAVWR